MRTTQPKRDRPQPDRGQRASSRRAGEQPVKPARVRQASVTSATLTPAERARLRMLAAANRAPAPSRAATPRAAGRHTPAQHPSGRHAGSRISAGPPALRRTTGIVLAIAGAILWLAVHTTLTFVATQRAGLVLLVTGMLWLWLPVPDKRDRLRRRFHQLVSFLEWDPASAQGARCSLEDLLEPRTDPAPDGQRE